MRLSSTFVRRAFLSKVLYIAIAFFATLALGQIPTARATITGPYAVDANTLHLWHLDAVNVSATESNDVAPANLQLTSVYLKTTTGSGRYVASGSSYAGSGYSGFGQAVTSAATAPGGAQGLGNNYNAPSNGSGNDDVSMNTFWNHTTGAFTYEAMVQWGIADASVFNNTYMSILSTTNDSIAANGLGANGVANGEIFQLGVGIGVGNDTSLSNLQFESPTLAGTDLNITIPTPSQGSWYQVAVTYAGGTGGAVRVYWTPVDPSQTAALLVGTGTMDPWDLGSTLTADFSVGNFHYSNGAGGSAPKQGWVGNIDEVRISDIARGASQFIFAPAPEPSSLALFAIGVVGIGITWLRKRK